MVREYSRRPLRRASPSVGTRRVGARGWVFAAMAMLALASPSLTALNPELAGWLPSHGHVYAGGMPVPHAHPWEAESSSLGSDENHDDEGASVAFTWDLSSTVQSLAVPAVVGVVLGAMWLLLLVGVQPLGLPSTAPAVPTPPPR